MRLEFSRVSAYISASVVVALMASPAGGGSQTLWNSGPYAYDGAGNITGIGAQAYVYDGVGRLKTSQSLAQATTPSSTDPYQFDYTYDIYGNMTNTNWTDVSIPGNAPTAGMEIAFDFSCSGNTNQIKSDGSSCAASTHKFAYDQNGNMSRMTGVAAQQQGATWDASNRMSSVYSGDPEAGGTVMDRYACDANGYRLVRYADGTDGRPSISVRDGSGHVMSEYIQSPGLGYPELYREYVQGLGQVLAERTVTVVPVITSQSTMQVGNDYAFSVVSGGGSPTFSTDIRTSGGAQSSQILGVTLDGSGGFKAPEANLTPGVTNYVRLRREGHPAEAYSAPVAILVDTSVNGSSENQVRGISVSRVDNEIRIRWAVASSNGKKFKIDFERADGSGTQDLTPTPLEASIRSFTMTAQSDSPPCGQFRLKQVNSASPPTYTASTPGVSMPPSRTQNLFWAEPGCGITGPGPGPSPGTNKVFANVFDHRDHLGSLRVVTDASGYVVETHDYYPFGQELASSGGLGISRMRFTGHEFDHEVGLSYLLARSLTSSQGRFLSVDPGSDQDPLVPSTWTKYSYVRNNPLKAVDPTGEYTHIVLYGKGYEASDQKGWRGDQAGNFRNAATTRAREIRGSAGFVAGRDEVVLREVGTKSEMISAINAKYESGSVRTIDTFSHGGVMSNDYNVLNLGEGVAGDYSAKHFTPADVRALSPQLTSDAQIGLYGCNTGYPAAANLGQQMADALGVPVTTIPGWSHFTNVSPTASNPNVYLVPDTGRYIIYTPQVGP